MERRKKKEKKDRVYDVPHVKSSEVRSSSSLPSSFKYSLVSFQHEQKKTKKKNVLRLKFDSSPPLSKGGVRVRVRVSVRVRMIKVRVSLRVGLRVRDRIRIRVRVRVRNSAKAESISI